MGTHYNQLTPDERYQIQALNELKFSARSIAITIGRSNKTVSRELNRTPNNDYDAQLANQDAIDKRKNSLKFNKRSSALLELIDTCLTYNFTPEQIAGRMRLEGCSNRVSLQTIYRIIYHKGWRHRLPRKGKPYRNRSRAGSGKSLIPKRCDITKRPEIVERNIQLGHWEGDTVHGADGYFVTLVERVSKTFLFARVKRKTKRAVAHAIKRMLAPYKGMCRTITFDNGGEFADHQSIARSLACSIYFATPYHSTALV